MALSVALFVNFGGFVICHLSNLCRCSLDVFGALSVTKAEIWRRLETSMVESDVMLHSSFMSRVGLDIAGRFFCLDITRLLCHVVSSHPEFDELSWIARTQREANGRECSSGCISEVCGDVCDSRNFHVGLLCFIASAFSRQQMLWMAVLPDQISYGNVWVPSER